MKNECETHDTEEAGFRIPTFASTQHQVLSNEAAETLDRLRTANYVINYFWGWAAKEIAEFNAVTIARRVA